MILFGSCALAMESHDLDLSLLKQKFYIWFLTGLKPGENLDTDTCSSRITQRKSNHFSLTKGGHNFPCNVHFHSTF